MSFIRILTHLPTFSVSQTFEYKNYIKIILKSHQEKPSKIYIEVENDGQMIRDKRC